MLINERIFHSDKVITWTWAGMTNGVDGSPASNAEHADRSVQVFGTFGVGGQVTLFGSNNLNDWSPLTDPQGNNLVISQAKIEQITECVLYVKPVCTGGDGSTSLTVVILGRSLK